MKYNRELVIRGDMVSGGHHNKQNQFKTGKSSAYLVRLLS